MPARQLQSDLVDPQDLPAVDDRLIMPDTRYEVVDAKVVHVSPALEPHGSRHSKLSALLEAYAAPGYNAASDMLTRTSHESDFAPDGSLYPAARDPETGGRQLEQLAFEVVSSESLAHAGNKASALVQRGVRRVFAIDVENERGLEWSQANDTWEILDHEAVIDDPALVLPLPVRDLVASVTTDDAVARALLAKRNRVLASAMEAERTEGQTMGKTEAILAVLESRGLAPTEAQRRTILATVDQATLDRWLASVAKCAVVAELLGLDDE